MDDQIGVAPDRRGEMGVIFFMQAVVTVGGVAVDGFLEAAQKLGAQGVTLRVIRENFEESRDFFAVRKIADLDFKSLEE